MRKKPDKNGYITLSPIERFPAELYRWVKVQAALKNKTIRQVFIDALRKHMEEA